MAKNYLKLISTLLSIGVLLFLFFKYDPVNNYLFPQCPFHAATGAYCPGCGSQRAMHALLHFDFAEVFRRNILFIPGILLVTYHYSIKLTNHYLKTNYKSILDHKWTPYVILMIVLVFWILRNLPFEPFLYLAP